MAVAPTSDPTEVVSAESKAEASAAGTLFSAALLALAGGTLDAFLYLTHDKVFAGAMTGNAVLWGIALIGGNGSEALHHFYPLLAFVCGVWTAEFLHARVKEHAVTVALGCEMAGVLAAGFLPPGFPSDAFVFLLAFLSAFQVSSFRKTDEQSYNSTFITGNMRTAAVGLYGLLKPEKRSEGLRQARALGLVIASFLAGAALSARLVSRLGSRTLLVPFAALLVVFALAVRRAVVAEP